MGRDEALRTQPVLLKILLSCSVLLPGLSGLVGRDTCEPLIYILSVTKLCLRCHNAVTEHYLLHAAANHYLPSTVDQVFFGWIPGCPLASALNDGLCLHLPLGSHAKLVLCHMDVYLDRIGL